MNYSLRFLQYSVIHTCAFIGRFLPYSRLKIDYGSMMVGTAVKPVIEYLVGFIIIHQLSQSMKAI